MTTETILVGGVGETKARFGNYELLASLHALPDTVALTTNEAAVFLRLSAKTLERMRLDGSGPPYIQGGARGARGINQKCMYLKEGLLAWQRGNEVVGAMQAAVRRGQAFATLNSILVEEPFYVSGETVIGSVWDAPLDVVLARLGHTEIMWLLPLEAASKVWLDVAGHAALAGGVIDVMSVSIRRVEAGQEATAISQAIGLGVGRSRSND